MKKLTLMSIIVLVFLAALSLSAIQCKPPKQEFKGKCYYPNDLGKAKATWKKKQAARRQARKRADKKDCENAKMSDTKYDWKKYLKKHPHGICSGKASERIDEVEKVEYREEARKREAEKYKEEARKRDAEKYKEFPFKHGELRWSKKATKKMNWYDAKEYCKDLGGRLPTISELRTLIKNCPKTETGGPCGVTDSCLSWGKCRKEACDGCSYDDSGKYSVLRDPYWLWSSTLLSGGNGDAWFLDFYYGSVSDNRRYIKSGVRCVR